jgi:hypothetical protein
MTPRDILAQLHAGGMRADEAEHIFDAVMDSPHSAAVQDLLVLSREEWKAFCFGVSFVRLADWRYNGWPYRCWKCGRELKAAECDWTIVWRNEQPQLQHVVCPPHEGIASKQGVG